MKIFVFHEILELKVTIDHLIQSNLWIRNQGASPLLHIPLLLVNGYTAVEGQILDLKFPDVCTPVEHAVFREFILRIVLPQKSFSWSVVL